MSKEQTDWVLVPRETLNAVRLYVDDCLKNRYIDAAAMGNLYAARDEIDRVSAAAPKPSTSTAEAEPVRELPRDLVTILRTEAKNQRTPPIDYVIAEDGGRMVHTPEPDIAMAELLEEAASALAAKDAELARRDMQLEASAKVALDLSAQLAEARKALAALDRMSRGVDWCDQDEQARRWSAARRALEGGQEGG